MGGRAATVAGLAVADLAGRLRIAPSDVVVAASRPRTWADASLGCPGHGTAGETAAPDGPPVEPAPVEGMQVVLRHRDRAYLYHAGPDGRPFLCPSGEPDGGYAFVPPPGIDV